MAIKIASNGNSSGPNDPNFIHFADEQTGVLLPTCPGYPAWLPSLQITLAGRLCFWNWPAALNPAVVSLPSNAGTSNFLRDSRLVTASNLYPAIPKTLPTVGSDTTLYDKCNTYFKMNSDFLTTVQSMYLMLKPNMSMIEMLSFPYASNAWYNAKAGEFTPNVIGVWQWIMTNIQYSLCKYLNKPYNIYTSVTYGKSWYTIMTTAAKLNDMGGTGWLSAVNFWGKPGPDPSGIDKVAQALPAALLVVAGGVLTFVSVGAATPLLLSGIKAMSTAVANSNKSQAQSDAQAAWDAANSGVNLTNLNADIAATGTLVPNVDNTTTYIFIGVSIVILILIIVLYKRKK